MHSGINKYRIIFVCFTYDNDHLPKTNSRSEIANHIRKWRDLWRKKYGCSPRYFATTDRGSQFGRLHLHLLIFNPFDKKLDKPLSIHRLEKENFHWRNGKVRLPTWLESERGISYVTGYITGSNLEKEAKKHGKIICKEALIYKPLVFVSNGLGASFLDNPYKMYDPLRNMYVYKYQGYTYALPSYYRYKLYDEDIRWHQNIIHKYETLHYLENTPFVRYRFNGNLVSAETLETIYLSSFARFDKDDVKFIDIEQITYAE